MEKEKTIQEVRQIFNDDKFAVCNGAVIEEIGDHTATCSLVLTDLHRNAMGAVMGGVYFTLADFTFAVAANWQKMGCVSMNANINFLGGTKGNKLIAKAVCVKNGKKTACYQVEVKDELDNLTAVVTITGYHLA
ncbi:MAG: PaaI family thioesterase [Clostridia bacterium]|nr:PaaI family thioesterase [Clostridia bacterium]